MDYENLDASQHADVLGWGRLTWQRAYRAERVGRALADGAGPAAALARRARYAAGSDSATYARGPTASFTPGSCSCAAPAIASRTGTAAAKRTVQLVEAARAFAFR